MASETLVIIDYGSQYTQLIARKTREQGVYSVILPHTTEITKIKALAPKAIVLSGGPNSINDKNSPELDPRIVDLKIPILGICYGLQILAKTMGGVIKSSSEREYGLANLKIAPGSHLLPKSIDNSVVWMSHGDHVSKVPAGFHVTATSSNGIISSIENPDDKLFGLQFHPEVYHSEKGEQIIEQFLTKISKFSKSWKPKSFIDSEISRIKEAVGSSHVICALSGGVDSSVSATLVHKAIGKQQTCIFVDTGLLRQGEYEEVLSIYKNIGLNIRPVQAGERFLGKLKGITDPEKKRKIIGNEFIKIFEEEASKIDDATFLVQGTLYPDVIESVPINGSSTVIKSHHNVGGLPEKMHLRLIEPLRELFKDEVRRVGKNLGLPSTVTDRQPFPGPGLAVRIIGDITAKNVALLQKADAIARQEIDKSPLDPKPWQYFAVLLPIKTVGVMGDDRTYDQVVAVRAIQSTDGMTANYSELPHSVLSTISSRIINEVKGINRVVYDITSKPPGTIEWE